jgi:hypothetical protein
MMAAANHLVLFEERNLFSNRLSGFCPAMPVTRLLPVFPKLDEVFQT